MSVGRLAACFAAKEATLKVLSTGDDAIPAGDRDRPHEILAPIAGVEPTAIASSNPHQDHFGATYGIALADGGLAHSACIAFEKERTVPALLRAPGAWRAELWPA